MLSICVPTILKWTRKCEEGQKSKIQTYSRTLALGIPVGTGAGTPGMGGLAHPPPIAQPDGVYPTGWS